MAGSWFICWNNRQDFPHRLPWASASRTSGCAAFLMKCCVRPTGHSGWGWLLTSPLPSFPPCVARSHTYFRSATSLGCYPALLPSPRSRKGWPDTTSGFGWRCEAGHSPAGKQPVTCRAKVWSLMAVRSSSVASFLTLPSSSALPKSTSLTSQFGCRHYVVVWQATEAHHDPDHGLGGPLDVVGDGHFWAVTRPSTIVLVVGRVAQFERGLIDEEHPSPVTDRPVNVSFREVQPLLLPRCRQLGMHLQFERLQGTPLPQIAVHGGLGGLVLSPI